MEKSQCYHPLSFHLMSHVQVFGNAYMYMQKVLFNRYHIYSIISFLGCIIFYTWHQPTVRQDTTTREDKNFILYHTQKRCIRIWSSGVQALPVMLFPQTRNFTPLCLFSLRCINRDPQHAAGGGGNPGMDQHPIQSHPIPSHPIPSHPL